MDAADKLVDSIFSLVKLEKECARALKRLAEEMEEKKKALNVTSVVGSSLSVGGAAALATAGAITLCTGGLAIPFLAGGGLIASGVGAITSIGSSVADAIIESSAMKDAESIVERIDNLQEVMRELVNTLAVEGMSGQQVIPPENYVMEQILRALGKSCGLRFTKDHDLVRFLFHPGGERYFMMRKNTFRVDAAFPLLGALIIGLISMKIIKEVAIKTTKEIAKQAGKQAASMAAKKGIAKGATSIATKTTAKALGKVGGGAVGLLFSVPELIYDIKNIAEDNCETKTSQRLKEQAEELKTCAEDLEEELDKIKAEVQRLVRLKHAVESTDRSRDERRRMISYVIEKCKDENVKQWLEENAESDAFFYLVDMFVYLTQHIKEEEEKDHENEIDIVFVAHGAIDSPYIPAACLLPLVSIKDVLLYSPWNCGIDANAAYGIATGCITPAHRRFFCTVEACHHAEMHHPAHLPGHWNSMSAAGSALVPNIMLSPLRKPADPAWEAFLVLNNEHGEPGRNRVVVPFIIPGKISIEVPFFVVTLALSLVLFFSRFRATVHLAACLNRRSRLEKTYLMRQYAYTIDCTAMTCSADTFEGDKRSDPLYRALKAVFG